MQFFITWPAWDDAPATYQWPAHEARMRTPKLTGRSPGRATFGTNNARRTVFRLQHKHRAFRGFPLEVTKKFDEFVFRKVIIAGGIQQQLRMFVSGRRSVR